ncbi:hypothetical protein BRADI_3g22090v3 [Brachypodium distachyon]|uniref:DUF6598 domain-containing protein n=1 Tax=Brachypodium distachyon TaxID=15368 RepID=I1I393_BRADI|nr:hypothetical protein BRADI_3g22090v3 [Brachypodium distachyon]
MERGGAQAASSSTSLGSIIALVEDPIEVGTVIQSGMAQVFESWKALRNGILGDGKPSEEKRRRMEDGRAQGVVSSGAERSRRTSGDGFTDAELLDDCKHRDGSIYRRTDYFGRRYRLHDISGTCLEPMIMSQPFTSCQPNWKDCKTHSSFPMLQIFSLKLAHSVVDGPVQLYGYLAVRDVLNPLRNYIFNRTRADPFIVERGGFIHMSGPKRGITMDAMVLTEFDMKIRRGKEGGDLQLIDGAIVFNNFGCRHGRLNTQRIHGDSGAVDISFALLHRAVEATVQVEISELRQGSGLSLCLTASHLSDYLLDEIRLFDGVIAAGGCELKRSVVAVLYDSKFLVALKLSQAGGSDHRVIHRLCVCQPALHGDTIFILKLGFTTIQLKVSWSSMNIHESLLPRESA